jgi:MFS family permease
MMNFLGRAIFGVVFGGLLATLVVIAVGFRPIFLIFGILAAVLLTNHIYDQLWGDN